MGMQDIEGHFALPLARPFSDLPPPFGRRRRPFVKSRQPKPGVFNLSGTRDAPARAAVRAADFGSDNKPWVKPRPARRKWRPTLMMLAAGLVFGSVGLAGTHAFQGARRGASRSSVYEGAVTTAPGPAGALPMTVSVGPDAGPVNTVAAPVASTGQAALVRDTTELTSGAAADAPSARKPAGASRRKVTRLQTARERLGGATPASAVAGGATSRGQGERQVDATPAAPRPTYAAVGMTAAEFSKWLAATREPARVTTASPGADLHVALPSHTRLTEAGAQ